MPSESESRRDVASRQGEPAPRVHVFGDFRFDAEAGRLTDRAGEVVELPHRATSVLHALLDRAGEVVDKGDLLESAWSDTHVTEDALVQAVGSLRRALGDDPRDSRYVRTVHGRGYRFVAPVRIPRAGDSVAPSRQAPSGDVPPGDRGRRRAWPWAAATVGAVLLVAVGVVAGRRSPTPIPAAEPVRFVLPTAGGEVPIDGRGQGSIAVSPDGRHLVYVRRGEAGTRLIHRSLDDPQGVAIRGTEGATGPFFEPRGERLGFFVRDELRTVPLAGGSGRTVGSIAAAAGATWADDGSIYVGSDAGLWRLDPTDDSAAPRPVSRVGDGERGHWWPHALPGDGVVLVTVWRESPEDAAIVAFDPGSGRRTPVLEGGTAPRYLADGRLAFWQAGALMTVSFDAAELRPSGLPATLAVDVFAHPYSGVGHYDLGGSTLAYLSGGATMAPSGRVERWSLEGASADSMVARSNVAPALPPPPGPVKAMRVEPRGRRLAAVVERGSGYGLWIADLATGTWAALPGLDSNVTGPTWSPDGTRMAVAIPGLDHDVAIVDVDGWRIERRLRRPGSQLPSSWIDPGRLLVSEWHGDTGWDLSILDVTGNVSRGFATSTADEPRGAVSPAGGWAALVVDDGRSTEIFVRPVDGGARPSVRVSRGGGTDPRWSVDGRCLFFRLDDDVFAVDFDPETGRVGGSPHRVARIEGLVHFDVAGSELLVYRAGEPRERRLHVVVGEVAEPLDAEGADS